MEAGTGTWAEVFQPLHAAGRARGLQGASLTPALAFAAKETSWFAAYTPACGIVSLVCF